MEITCITSIHQRLDLVNYMLKSLRRDSYMCYSMERWMRSSPYLLNKVTEIRNSLTGIFLSVSKGYSTWYEDDVKSVYDCSEVLCAALLPELLKYKPKILHYMGGWFNPDEYNVRMDILEKVKKELLEVMPTSHSG